MKLQWMPFNTGAWKKDMRRHQPDVQGNWMNIICSIWDTGKTGTLTMSVSEWALELGISEQKTTEFLTYLKNREIADVTFCNGQCNGNVTVTCRRIERWFKERQHTALRVAKFREKKKSNAKVTPDVTVQSKSKRKNKEKETTKECVIVSFPDWLNLEKWAGYKEMRVRIQKPMTKLAEKLAIEKLAQLKEQKQNPDDVLGQSIFNSWQGLYPIKQDQLTKGKQPRFFTCRSCNEEKGHDKLFANKQCIDCHDKEIEMVKLQREQRRKDENRD